MLINNRKVQFVKIICVLIIPLLANCTDKSDFTRSYFSAKSMNIKGEVMGLFDTVYSVEYINNTWEKVLKDSGIPYHYYENVFFNKEGLIVKKESMVEDSSLFSSEIYKYSPSNQISGINKYLGHFLSDSIYDIFISGNKFCYKGYSHGIQKGLIYSDILRLYYKNGLVYQEKLDHNTSQCNRYSEIIYTRNEKGDVVKEVREVEFQKLDRLNNTYTTITKYLEYDEQNNWMKKISYLCREGEEPNSGHLTVRYIKYKE